ncbi:hypothetical protein KPH14_006045 [Odynerus spinipes]|uniref:Alpha N-terminal protein methyltransferase 1 n=1 Tax=Odynerus spinipes TaxID=1348599 RepID=A0AAD9VP70_9HYME|nr:hypothetical protein KPH14_006045 [Odynerus spinipes]
MEEINKTEPHNSEFYTAAAKYWDRVPPTVDGMLGGFGFLSQTDVKGSTHFLNKLFELKNPPSKTFALDCGAGIGRITKNLLIKHFKRVDLVEQNPKFLETAKTYLNTCISRIGEFYPTGLQNFCPTPQKYDVIWCQWVLGHLRDDDLIQFFKNCVLGLTKNGVLVVKENVTRSNTLEIDTTDSSVTRPYEDLLSIFEKAGLVCLTENLQHNMPRALYPVYMFALRSKSQLAETSNNG